MITFYTVVRAFLITTKTSIAKLATFSTCSISPVAGIVVASYRTAYTIIKLAYIIMFFTDATN